MGCTGSILVAGATATVSLQSPRTDSSKSSTADGVGLTGTVTVKTWVGGADGTLTFPEVEDPDYAIPALSSGKAPLAICISGGGLRAATLGLGWLRALHELKVLGQAKYLVTVSGKKTSLSTPICKRRHHVRPC